MNIDDLNEDTLSRLKTSRYDRIIEKHEGPFSWERLLRQPAPDDIVFRMMPDYDPIAETPEFIPIGGFDTLLPIGRHHHPNLTILHYFRSEDGQKLVAYLKDTTYADDLFGAGYVAVCDRQPEGFYLATLYHEWFIIDYDTPVRS